jgi:hypothetical protein
MREEWEKRAEAEARRKEEERIAKEEAKLKQRERIKIRNDHVEDSDEEFEDVRLSYAPQCIILIKYC